MLKTTAQNISAPDERAHSSLEFSVASTAFAITAMVLCFDMLAGPLRFYLSRLGLESIIYLPKGACLLFVLRELARTTVHRTSFIAVAGILLYSAVGLFHQAGIASQIFTLLMFAPFLFGVCAGGYLREREEAFVRLLAVVFVTTALGVFLDLYVDFPWKGFAYSIGGTDIEGTRDWTTMGFERVAGFARMSTAAAFYLVCSGLFLYSYSRSTLMKYLVLLLAFPAVLATTNKAGVGGLLLGFTAILLCRFPKVQKILVVVLALAGMLLPVSTLLRSYDIDLTDPLSLLLLASFDDRLINTWPGFFAAVSRFGNPVTGVGFGGVGSAIKYFSRGNRETMAFADNFSLYLYGCFGLLAVFLFLYLAKVTLTLFRSEDRLSSSMAAGMVALLGASLTTDVIEAQVFAIMLGIAVALSTATPAPPSGAAGGTK